MTTKEKIREYLEQEYSKTRWPNIYLANLMHLFGADTTEALNELYSEGIVKPDVGVNGRLVIYVEGVDEREYVKAQYAKHFNK